MGHCIRSDRYSISIYDSSAMNRTNLDIYVCA
jgi:hypothetical protein